MQTVIFPNHNAMSLEAARVTADYLRKKPDALFCFAAGHTQIETLAHLVRIIREECIPVDKAHWIGLDEWVGYGRGDRGSCIEFVSEHFFAPLSIGPDQYFFFDGKAADVAVQCAVADTYVDDHGGIDFVLLGVGLNGHLGFNEPGVDAGSRAYIVQLDSTSVDISSKYFGKSIEVSAGITLGLRDLLAAEEVIVQCTGAHKAEITGKLLNGAITNAVPASLVRNLAQCRLFLDETSAPAIDII